MPLVSDESPGVRAEVTLAPRVHAGIGSALVLAVLVLLLWAVVDPTLGKAAPPRVGPAETSQTEPAAFAPTFSSYVYMPLVSRSRYLPPNRWLGDYYDNDSLAGGPEYTLEELWVDYDWGDGGSPSELDDDHFSVRWTGRWEFDAGKYTFFAHADDGIRLWLDDTLLIDAWSPGIGDYEETVDVSTAGFHVVKLEYFENTGEAAIQLYWRRTDLFPLWQADLYNDPWAETSPMGHQVDAAIQFDWGLGCPRGMSFCDEDFSVSWDARPLFEAGNYWIFVYADDGYKLFVDGDLVSDPDDGWNDEQEDHHYLLPAACTDDHRIIFQAHDRGNIAEARLWIENVDRPEWTAEYYEGKGLSGDPVKTRSEEAVFHDWKYDKPLNALNEDEFSVRWSGPRFFHAGWYRFGVFADDGVRLWADGQLLINEWHDGRSEHRSRLTYLSTGDHDLVIEYYEASGEAEIRYWWE